MEESNRYCKVCVTGGSGFIGSCLIKKLLNKGIYHVHATLRDLGDITKVNRLKGLEGAETRLQLFEADIYNPQQFEGAIKDCQYVFHVATPLMHTQQSQDYVISKTESEKAALKFGEGGDLEVVTLACGLVGGQTILSYTYLSSVMVMISPLTDIEFNYKALKDIEDLCGKVPIIHLEDACEAHIFCIENDSIKGRFLCASDYVSAAEIAECLQQTHPELHIKPMYMEGSKRAIKWGSTKLIDQGFKYKHDIKMILDDCVKSWRKLEESS